MILNAPSQDGQGVSVPRMRGDDPMRENFIGFYEYVFPACAGMILIGHPVRHSVIGVPRMRGEDPSQTLISRTFVERLYFFCRWKQVFFQITLIFYMFQHRLCGSVERCDRPFHNILLPAMEGALDSCFHYGLYWFHEPQHLPSESGGCFF